MKKLVSLTTWIIGVINFYLNFPQERPMDHTVILQRRPRGGLGRWIWAVTVAVAPREWESPRAFRGQESPTFLEEVLNALPDL